ncbi:hypothetical protein [Pseudoalteromonas aurantia]|uniref:Uncharacterized protein n=1 Tax=Pseudoalteromonas aurantia 208 TaxID=1314867 RepID=A0ABR9E9D1_9GAMM|nr:hypothetical protein [Pseudoalteromonas aurantia]MBE0367605.1 hypothetical protein [Pseudoalteromonas aurantia 208]
MQILEALPTIHGIFLGIGTAFFSAFALFAYQKYEESKNKLVNVLSEAESYHEGFTMFKDENFISEGGSLDWGGSGKKVLRKAKSFYQDLDYKEYKIPRQAQSDTDIYNTTHSLCSFLSQLISSYLFSDINNLAEFKKSDTCRLKEISTRINLLNLYWQSHSQSLIALAERCTKVKSMQTQLNLKEEFEQQISSSQIEYTNEEKNDIWHTSFQPRLKDTEDYGQILTKYFDIISVYNHRVIPQLTKSLAIHQQVIVSFNLKENTVLALKATAFIFVLGILTPIFLLGLKTDIQLVWSPFLPYFLAVLTCIPYVFVWIKLFRKVKNMNYR